MTNKKHNYDWEAMGLDPDEDRIIYAFEWGETPQGGEWWSDNKDTPEGKAEFARMKRLYAEDMAAMESLDWFRLTRPLWPNDEKEGPVRTDPVACRTCQDFGWLEHALQKCQECVLAKERDALTDAIETLTQIRDAL